MLKKKKKEVQDKKIQIRKTTKKDFPQIWQILQEIADKGETYNQQLKNLPLKNGLIKKLKPMLQ